MVGEDRIVSPQKQVEDDVQNSANPVSLRPNSLAEFVGQR